MTGVPPANIPAFSSRDTRERTTTRGRLTSEPRPRKAGPTLTLRREGGKHGGKTHLETASGVAGGRFKQRCRPAIALSMGRVIEGQREPLGGALTGDAFLLTREVTRCEAKLNL